MKCSTVNVDGTTGSLAKKGRVSVCRPIDKPSLGGKSTDTSITFKARAHSHLGRRRAAEGRARSISKLAEGPSSTRRFFPRPRYRKLASTPYNPPSSTGRVLSHALETSTRRQETHHHKRRDLREKGESKGRKVDQSPYVSVSYSCCMVSAVATNRPQQKSLTDITGTSRARIPVNPLLSHSTTYQRVF